MSTQAPVTDPAALLAKLRTVPLFAALTEAEAVCVAQAQELHFRKGEVLVEEGGEATRFYALLEGEFSVSKFYSGQETVLARYLPGMFFGEVPLLLGVRSIVTARALAECRLIAFPAAVFWKLLRLCPSVAGQIFRAMAARLRNLEGSAQQREKLAALGTMSAGLAHELNNPSAAARRAAVHLEEAVIGIQELGMRLHHLLGSEQWCALIGFVGEALSALPPVRRSAVEQSDLEERVAAALRAKGLADAWQIAPGLASALPDLDALKRFAEKVPPAALPDALRWIETRLSIRALLDEAEQSTARIADLVNAVRSYAHQEKAESAEVDVRQQLEAALDALAERLRGVTVVRDFAGDASHVRAYPSELQQVWVNLLENAADALAGKGRITVSTRREADQLLVEICDDGPGISEEDRARIFEPFFTTKAVGAGVGLGLVICERIVGERHGGEIEVESKPGWTCFRVRLPLRRDPGATAPTPTPQESGARAEIASAISEAETQARVVEGPPGASYATVFDVPLFAELEPGQRHCLALGETIEIAEGEEVFRQNAPSDYFYVVLSGDLQVMKTFENQEIVLASPTAGGFFGEIQIMLDIPYVATIRALRPSRLFRLPRAGFYELLRVSQPIAVKILRMLATRVKNLEGWSQEREKLAQLGTMAAGLAHELNNPAAAARRAAAALRESVEAVQDVACELHAEVDAAQWERLVAASREAVHCTLHEPPLDAMAQSDREEEITAWLERHEYPEPWELASALVTARTTPAELDALAAIVPGALLHPALRWLGTVLATRELLHSIKHSTARITELVEAVKAYSFMDQAPWKEIDLHDGLESTLTILSYKLRNVTVERAFDRTIPRLCAYGGELNQVWTNLIDNAIYAVGGQGRIRISTAREGQEAVVTIADNGAGIPPDAQQHIFEPFFTTKGRSGTGLGLIISHRIVEERHRGKMTFTTKPGATEFTVRLPLDPPSPA